MGVHRKQGAENHRGPAELRCVIQPTAENKYEQIARLVQDIEWRLALKTVAREIIDSSEGDQRCEPEQNFGAFQIPENSQEDCLHESDLHGQLCKLFARPSSPEEECPFARVEAIGFDIRNVVPSINDESERQGNVDQSEPETG